MLVTWLWWFVISLPVTLKCPFRHSVCVVSWSPSASVSKPEVGGMHAIGVISSLTCLWGHRPRPTSCYSNCTTCASHQSSAPQSQKGLTLAFSVQPNPTQNQHPEISLTSSQQLSFKFSSRSRWGNKPLSEGPMVHSELDVWLWACAISNKAICITLNIHWPLTSAPEIKRMLCQPIPILGEQVPEVVVTT